MLVQPRARNLLPQTTSMYDTLLAPSFSSLPTPMAPVRPTLFVSSFFGRVWFCAKPTTTGSYSCHSVSHFKCSSGTGNLGFWPGRELRESRHLSAHFFTIAVMWLWTVETRWTMVGSSKWSLISVEESLEL